MAAAENPFEFSRMLSEGVSSIEEIPESRFDINAYYSEDREKSDKIYTRSGSFIDRPDQFDAGYFKLSPREARIIDPQCRILLEESVKAIEQSNTRISQVQKWVFL